MTHAHLNIPAELPDPPADDLPEMLRDLVAHAAQCRATDIHLDAWQNGAAVRLRIDGRVQPYDALDAEQTRRLINQVRVAAGLEIDAVHEAQEGHLRWRGPDRTIDLRVTDTPTAPEDRAVHLRMLSAPGEAMALDELGLRDPQLERLKEQIAHQQGLTLIAGPTGAGKTTTLYALLESNDLARRVAVAIEEPAEIDLPYVRQIEVDERAGRDMAGGLRLALRMDPDLLGVGEVRDAESARIAARAAQSGKSVLATIHGRDATSAIIAMHYLGVPYAVLASAVRTVMAQALVRQLCTECGTSREPHDEEREAFDRHGVDVPEQVFEAVGCEHCRHIGYRGRRGLFQIATLDSDTSAKLARGPRESDLRDLLRERGAEPLAVEALRAVAAGQTSFAEVAYLINDH
jgi:general secretion pathway protein E